ncbi:hypothetical protein B0H15DRAFT_866772 [Mycena belliarum]|uniref:Uncharacterized protein n=1 Tax=Mycena belliarum TaxID=1033014 RepID=A0AAD6TR98_9AGAR|nr:hypothetical protein B0H15DRAFT_866772 [Mycena belliae]
MYRDPEPREQPHRSPDGLLAVPAQFSRARRCDAALHDPASSEVATALSPRMALRTSRSTGVLESARGGDPALPDDEVSPTALRSAGVLQGACLTCPPTIAAYDELRPSLLRPSQASDPEVETLIRQLSEHRATPVVRIKSDTNTDTFTLKLGGGQRLVAGVRVQCVGHLCGEWEPTDIIVRRRPGLVLHLFVNHATQQKALVQVNKPFRVPLPPLLKHLAARLTDLSTRWREHQRSRAQAQAFHRQMSLGW